ncbi:L-aspartate oxidase [Bacillus sp. NPDC077027]|uniref:L-aspartate oxidase n=1 Tax=Bacillus sp. NPDC077027 TaxID=3390548 RepID=UPI003D0715FA
MSLKRVIVVGSGIAALSFAANVSKNCEVIMMTKHRYTSSNSMLAQGGIATSYLDHDSIEQHMLDTLVAGCGHNDIETVVDVLTTGKQLVSKLIKEGCPFDQDSSGDPKLGKEGAHSIERILHAGGDQTGKTIVNFLKNQLGSHIHLYEHCHVIDLLVDEGRCFGVLFKDEHGCIQSMTADAVVLSTGGCGQLYETNTNDSSITGDGIMMAYRAGAQIADLEFVQFHPTLLSLDGRAAGLISEAVRGEGAFLEDEAGNRIMEGLHPQLDLAPRDVVARAIYQKQQQGHHIYLNIRKVQHFSKRFPTVFSLCQKAGIHMDEGRLPVSPGMHFLMGGIMVNDEGETAVKALYAIGETACTGLHGANRLASNSLLEGLVYGYKVAGHIDDQLKRHKMQLNMNEERYINVPLATAIELQQLISKHLAILRNHKGLQTLLDVLRMIPFQRINVKNITNEQLELANSWALAICMTQSAQLRTESRGGHFRTDYPDRLDTEWQGQRIVHQKGKIHIVEHERIGDKWNVYS